MRTKRAGAGNCGVGHAAVNLQLRNAAENLLVSHRGELRPKAAEVLRAVAKATVNLQPLATENSRPLAGGEFAGKIVRWGIQPLWLEKSQPQPISQLGHRMDDNDAMSDGKTPSGVSRESIGNQLVLGSSQPLPHCFAAIKSPLHAASSCRTSPSYLHTLR